MKSFQIFIILVSSYAAARSLCRNKRQSTVTIGRNLKVPSPGSPGSFSFPVDLPGGWRLSGPVQLSAQQSPVPIGMTMTEQVVTGGQVPITGGRVIPVRSPGSLRRKLSDGSTVIDCFDWRSGHHRHGNTWNTTAWQLKCNNGSVDVEACLTNSGEAIPANQTRTIDGFWHKCEETQSQVRYSAEPACVVNGKRLHINETFRSGRFKMSCQETGYPITGCYYQDSDGNEKELGLGESVDEGIIRHSCMEEPGEHPRRVRYQQSANGCKYNGTLYKIGDKWKSRHKEFMCEEGGGIAIKSCITDDGTKVGIGESAVINNKVHSCYQLGSVIYYHAYYCGEGTGVSCVPQPMSTESDSSTVQVAESAVGRQMSPSSLVAHTVTNTETVC